MGLVAIVADRFGARFGRRRRVGQAEEEPRRQPGAEEGGSGQPEPGVPGAGSGRRADWRHLIGPRRLGQDSTTLLLGLGPADDWTWLVDDGWTARVAVDVAQSADPPGHPGADRTAPFDVVVVGPGWAGEAVGWRATMPSAAADRLARARAALADGGTLLVLEAGGRQAGLVGRSGAVATALARGPATPSPSTDPESGPIIEPTSVRRYLVLPDLAGPRRFIPIDTAGGPAWLAGPVPRLASARLTRRRRLLRKVAARVAIHRPELLGDVAVVAGPPPALGPAVVLTSGFDEGSRTVVLPIGDGGRPTSVVKLTSRPSYAANADREHELLARLAPAARPPGLVPEPVDRLEIDGVNAVVERYAGRWTVTDALEEQGSVRARAALLSDAADAIGDLAGTGRRTETWNGDGFDDLIGRWFDAADEAEGPSPARLALRRDLARRSAELEGAQLPIGVRHFDLGPWNMVLADAEPPSGDGGAAATADLTVVDWELAPPRHEPLGPIGADLLYFVKYWLHIAEGCGSADEELATFAFLTPDGPARTPGLARAAARATIAHSTEALGVPLGFLPLIEATVWAEAAAYKRARNRQGDGGGGRPARYLDAVAHHRAALLACWPA